MVIRIQQRETSIEILVPTLTHLSLMQPALTGLETISDTAGPVVSRNASHRASSRRPDTLAPVITDRSTISIQARMRRQCPGFCRCQCHSRSINRSVHWTHALAGSMLSRYNETLRSVESQCDIQACRSNSQAAIELNYSFPDWLLRRAMSLSTSRVSLTNPGSLLFLTVPRVNDLEGVALAVDRRDFEWLQTKLRQGCMLPTDIFPDGEGYLKVSPATHLFRISV